MVINKRKKNSRQRGSFTHGWGSKKKHRGAGHRGGKGNAGTGKKGDAKKPTIWKNKKYFGKFGFKRKVKEKIKTINLKDIQIKLNSLIQKKLAKEENGFYVVDVTKLGYNKVLGLGKLNNKFKIISKYFSKGAVEKIKKSGGEAVELKPKDEKKAEA